MQCWELQQKPWLEWGPASPPALAFGSALVFKYSPTGDNDSHSHIHHKTLEIVIYHHLYQWNLENWETGDVCGAAEQKFTAEFCICTKSCKNSPRLHAGVAGLLLTPGIAVCTSSVNFLIQYCAVQMCPVAKIPKISGLADGGGWPWHCLISCSIPGAGFSLAIPISVVFLVFDALWVTEEDFLQGSW